MWVSLSNLEILRDQKWQIAKKEKSWFLDYLQFAILRSAIRTSRFESHTLGHVSWLWAIDGSSRRPVRSEFGRAPLMDGYHAGPANPVGTERLANRTMNEKDAPRPIHELEPPPQTAAKPESVEDMTILARWLYRGLEQGPLFWVFLGGAALVLTGISVVVSSLMAAKSVTGQAWIDLVPAKTAEEQLKVADAHPKTPVADWARLQAAYEEYRSGLDDLTSPGKRESAGPRLKRALDLFEQVVKDAPKESPQARGAAFAVARVLEARNELPEAIKQYRLVAETWKDSPEAKQAEGFARSLEDPENIQFYKELYAAKPSATSVGPLDDIPPIPTPPPVAPGLKPFDPLAPGSSLLGIDPPPPLTAPTPAPTSTPIIDPAPTTTPAKPADAPKAETTPPTANPPK